MTAGDSDHQTGGRTGAVPNNLSRGRRGRLPVVTASELNHWHSLRRPGRTQPAASDSETRESNSEAESGPTTEAHWQPQLSGRRSAAARARRWSLRRFYCVSESFNLVRVTVTLAWSHGPGPLSSPLALGRRGQAGTLPASVTQQGRRSPVTVGRAVRVDIATRISAQVSQPPPRRSGKSRRVRAAERVPAVAARCSGQCLGRRDDPTVTQTSPSRAVTAQARDAEPVPASPTAVPRRRSQAINSPAPASLRPSCGHGSFKSRPHVGAGPEAPWQYGGPQCRHHDPQTRTTGMSP